MNWQIALALLLNAAGFQCEYLRRRYPDRWPGRAINKTHEEAIRQSAE